MKLFTIAILLFIFLSSCKEKECAKNYVTDGSFENQTGEFIQTPFKTKPQTQEFIISHDKGAAHGEKYLTMKAKPQFWYEVYQMIELEANKKYRASIKVKGDSCEMHFCAKIPDRYLGRTADTIRSHQWTTLSYEFYSDSLITETKTFFSVRNDAVDAFIVKFDDFRIEMLEE